VASEASRVRGARTFNSSSESPSPRPLHAGRACPTCAPCLPNSGKPEFGGERETNRRARSRVEPCFKRMVVQVIREAKSHRDRRAKLFMGLDFSEARLLTLGAHTRGPPCLISPILPARAIAW